MNLVQWIIPWEPSVIVSATAIITVLAYIRGCLKINVPVWQKMFFWLGFILAYIVSHTEFDYYAEHEFFIHRIQHGILHHIGPIFIVLSRPQAPLSTGLPLGFRRLLQTASQMWPIREIIDTLMHPALVTIMFIGLIYFWLIPPVHFIGMLDWRLYRLMNWGMLVNGLMFWGLVLGPARPGALSTGSRIAMMLVLIPPQIIVGAIIFYASHELYPIYTTCGRAFVDISPMTDQQIGGLILWIFGSMMSVIGVLIIFQRELASRRQAPL